MSSIEWNGRRRQTLFIVVMSGEKWKKMNSQSLTTVYGDILTALCGPAITAGGRTKLDSTPPRGVARRNAETQSIHRYSIISRRVHSLNSMSAIKPSAIPWLFQGSKSTTSSWQCLCSQCQRCSLILNHVFHLLFKPDPRNSGLVCRLGFSLGIGMINKLMWKACITNGIPATKF